MRGLHHRTASSLTASTSTAHDLLCRVHLHHAARPPAANWTGLLAVSAWAATSGPAHPSSSLASWSQQRQRWAVQLFSTTNRRCDHMAGADEQLIGLEDDLMLDASPSPAAARHMGKTPTARTARVLASDSSSDDTGSPAQACHLQGLQHSMAAMLKDLAQDAGAPGARHSSSDDLHMAPDQLPALVSHAPKQAVTEVPHLPQLPHHQQQHQQHCPDPLTEAMQSLRLVAGDATRDATTTIPAGRAPGAGTPVGWPSSPVGSAALIPQQMPPCTPCYRLDGLGMAGTLCGVTTGEGESEEEYDAPLTFCRTVVRSRVRCESPSSSPSPSRWVAQGRVNVIAEGLLASPSALPTEGEWAPRAAGRWVSRSASAESSDTPASPGSARASGRRSPKARKEGGSAATSSLVCGQGQAADGVEQDGEQFFTPEGSPVAQMGSGDALAEGSGLVPRVLGGSGLASGGSSGGSGSAGPLTFTRTVRRGRRPRVLQEEEEEEVEGAGAMAAAHGVPQSPRRRTGFAPSIIVAPPRPISPEVVVISSSDEDFTGDTVAGFPQIAGRAPQGQVWGREQEEPAPPPAQEGAAREPVRGALELAVLLNRQCRLSDLAPEQEGAAASPSAEQPQGVSWGRPGARQATPGTGGGHGGVTLPRQRRPRSPRATHPDVPAQPTQSTEVVVVDLVSTSDGEGGGAGKGRGAGRAGRGGASGRGGKGLQGSGRKGRGAAVLDSSEEEEAGSRTTEEEEEEAEEEEVVVPSPRKGKGRGRGRPPKTPAVVVTTPGATPSQQQLQLVPKRRRGRPPGSTGPATSHLAFTRKRAELVQSLYKEWNALVFGGRLPADLPLVWNPRLLSTAGQVLDDGSRNREKADPSERIATSLELSTKVVDSVERLRSTLAHEMCHVAAWSLDREFHPHHGAAFWRWAGKISAAVQGVTVTRLHSFATFAPYRWRCQNPSCGKTYSRHRETIDPQRHMCGVCHGKLSFMGKFDRSGALVSGPGGAAAGKEGKEGEAGGAAGGGAPHAYRQFVKQNFAEVKSSQPPGTPHGAIMKALSSKWSEIKTITKQQQAQQQQAALGQRGQEAGGVAVEGLGEGLQTGVAEVGDAGEAEGSGPGSRGRGRSSSGRGKGRSGGRRSSSLSPDVDSPLRMLRRLSLGGESGGEQ